MIYKIIVYAMKAVHVATSVLVSGSLLEVQRNAGQRPFAHFASVPIAAIAAI